ncbi:MAG: hypothetical protein DELT_01933 [Desulfovibrio sp.]
MELQCVIQFPGCAGPETEAFFAARGWQSVTPESFRYSLNADLGGVDGPALELHAKIRGLYASQNPAPHSAQDAQENTVPVNVLITVGDREMFSEPARFVAFVGAYGLRISETEPPFFDDILRLRDKTIATLVAISRGQ